MTLLLAGVAACLIVVVVSIFVARSYSAESLASNSLVGMHGRALENFSARGTISVNGEEWKAVAARGLIAKDDTVIVLRMLDRLTLEVEKVTA